MELENAIEVLGGEDGSSVPTDGVLLDSSLVDSDGDVANEKLAEKDDSDA